MEQSYVARRRGADRRLVGDRSAAEVRRPGACARALELDHDLAVALVREEDVGGLDVTVDNARFMGLLQANERLADDAEGDVGGNGPTRAIRWWRSSPTRYSITMKRLPVALSSLESRIRTRCGESIAPAALASRRKRFVTSSLRESRSDLMSLTATPSSVAVSSAS